MGTDAVIGSSDENLFPDVDGEYKTEVNFIFSNKNKREIALSEKTYKIPILREITYVMDSFIPLIDKTLVGEEPIFSAKKEDITFITHKLIREANERIRIYIEDKKGLEIYEDKRIKDILKEKLSGNVTVEIITKGKEESLPSSYLELSKNYKKLLRLYKFNPQDLKEKDKISEYNCLIIDKSGINIGDPSIKEGNWCESAAYPYYKKFAKNLIGEFEKIKEKAKPYNT